MANKTAYGKFLRNKPNNIGKVILELKNKKKVDEFIPMINSLIKNRVYQDHIVGLLFPKSFNEIRREKMHNADLEKELLMYAVVVKTYSPVLNQFIPLKRRFSMALLSGHLAEAETILNEIEIKFGVSVWLLENRIALLNEMHGIKRQKEFTSSILDDHRNTDILRYMAYFFSQRAENTVSARRYEMNFLKSLGVKDYKDDFSDYLLFKLNLYGSRKINKFAGILKYEEALPLIDRYITFVNICKLMFATDNPSYKSFVEHGLIILDGEIQDNELINLGHLFGVQEHKSSDEFIPAMKVLDYYTVGDYEAVVHSCKEILEKNEECFELYEIYVKSLIRLNRSVAANYAVGQSRPLRYEIMEKMQDMMVKSQNTPDAISYLLKIINVYSSHSWAGQLIALLAKEAYLDDDIAHFVITYGEISQHYHNPKNIHLMFNEEVREKYVEWVLTIYKDSPTLKLHYMLADGNIHPVIEKLGIEDNRRIKYSALVSEMIGDNKAATSLYNCLLASPDPLLYQDAVVRLSYIYLSENKVEDCINLITDAVIKNEHIFIRLPIQSAVEQLERDNTVSSSNISVPILYHIYSKYFKTDKDVIKAEKCEDFLMSREIERPSELGGKVDEFNLPQLVYFLRYLCIPSVLDMSIVYISSEDIEKERIAVCQLLAQIDTYSAAEYTNEIKEITERLMIQSAKQVIEQSKIYVDIEGIKNSVETNLKESFARYRTLPDNMGKGVLLNLATGQFVVPKDEKLALFSNMILDLRDNFISNNEYGLDGYLSVGIRHGTLSGHIRSPLDLEKLITVKDSETNTYKANEYWRKKYKHIPSSTLTKLSRSLSDFSSDVDELIALLKNRWIQIRTEVKNPEGLFDFRLSALEIKTLQISMNSYVTYEEFIDHGLNTLWRVVDCSLHIIRIKISTEFKERFDRVFDKLLKAIQEISQDCDFEEINDSIHRAKTAIPYELDAIANWFKRSQESYIEDFEASFPVSIALEILKNTFPNNPIEPEISVQKLKLKGKTLKCFVNILCMLLDNVIQHSKIEIPKVGVDISCASDIVTMRIKSEFGVDVSIDNLAKKIEHIQESLDSGRSFDKVKVEGGTGFHKIKKIIDIDLRCIHSMKICLLHDRIFEVVIDIDSKGIVVNENINR